MDFGEGRLVQRLFEHLQHCDDCRDSVQLLAATSRHDVAVSGNHAPRNLSESGGKQRVTRLSVTALHPSEEIGQLTHACLGIVLG